VPFVAKAIGQPLAAAAAKVMAGQTLGEAGFAPPTIRRVAVKEAVFPFARFPGVDPILGPEMRSTGEVMGWDDDFSTAFLKSQIAVGSEPPQLGTVFISVKDSDKAGILAPAGELLALGFRLIATSGTAKYLAEHGIAVEPVNKVIEGQPHIVDAMINGQVQLVFNTTEGAQALKDSFTIRTTALTQKIPYYTTLAAARASVQAIAIARTRPLDVQPLQATHI